MKRRDKKLWICAGGYIVILLFLCRISAWGAWADPAPWRALLEMLNVLVWMSGIYWRWAGRWQREDNGAWAALLVISAVPHIPLSLVGYGSRICLAGSGLMGIIMCLWNRKIG